VEDDPSFNYLYYNDPYPASPHQLFKGTPSTQLLSDVANLNITMAEVNTTQELAALPDSAYKPVSHNTVFCDGCLVSLKVTGDLHNSTLLLAKDN
jgi:hypothetical protein